MSEATKKPRKKFRFSLAALILFQLGIAALIPVIGDIDTDIHTYKFHVMVRPWFPNILKVKFWTISGDSGGVRGTWVRYVGDVPNSEPSNDWAYSFR